jgi:hypothetical protein
VDRFACFRWDEVEWAIRDLDEAVETNAGGSHDVKELLLLISWFEEGFLLLEKEEGLETVRYPV